MKGLSSSSIHCSICGRKLSGVSTVTSSTRKNKRGRMAWLRDSVCEECKKERENNA